MSQVRPLLPDCACSRSLSVGVRYPTTVGYILITPLLFALGLPGESTADWASGAPGKALYITVLTCIGSVNNLINATGAVECACKSRTMTFHENSH